MNSKFRILDAMKDAADTLPYGQCPEQDSARAELDKGIRSLETQLNIPREDRAFIGDGTENPPYEHGGDLGFDDFFQP